MKLFRMTAVHPATLIHELAFFRTKGKGWPFRPMGRRPGHGLFTNRTKRFFGHGCHTKGFGARELVFGLLGGRSFGSGGSFLGGCRSLFGCCRGGGRIILGSCIRLGRRVIGIVSVVRFVKSAALKENGRSGPKKPLQFVLFAFGALFQGCFAEGLEFIKAMRASGTQIFIGWHRYCSLFPRQVKPISSEN